MPPHASPALRWARAGVVAAVALGTGVVAHVSADGLLPGPVGLIVLAVLLTALTAVFLGRRASTLRLVTLVVAGQGFIHSGLAALAGHRGELEHGLEHGAAPASLHPALPPPGNGQRTGSYFDQWAQAHPVGDSGPAVPSWMVHAVSDVLTQPSMAAAHVLAAVAVGLWLAVGERALWAVLTFTAAVAVRLVRALAAGLRLPPVPAAAPAPRSHRRARIPRTLHHSPDVPRRGPPFVLAA